MATRYTKDHEWVRMDAGVAIVGITAHAAEQLGDVVFVELPAKGAAFKQHDDMAVVESVKAASDVYAPVGGKVVAINESLNAPISGEILEANAAIVDDPAKVNADPEGASWFVKIKPSSPAEFDALMDAAAYKKLLESA